MPKSLLKERLIGWSTLAVFALAMIYEEKIPLYGVVLPLIGAIATFFGLRSLPIIRMFPSIGKHLEENGEDSIPREILNSENTYITVR